MKGVLIIAPLIVVIVLGMVLRAKRFLDSSDRERLTRLLYWIVLPALLFRTTYLAGGNLSRQFNLFIAVYLSLCLVPILGAIISCFRHRGDRKMHALSAMASARSNNMYLGLPAVILALGDEGAAAASVYLAITMPGFNMITLLGAELILSGGISIRKLGGTFVKILKNPLIFSCLLGLAFAQIGIPVPKTLLVSMKLIGDMATGVALIALGMSLELGDLFGALRRAWPDVFIKLLVHPGVTWLLLLVFPVDQTMFRTAIIMASMPTAVNTFILAGGMGLNEKYACEIVAMTTVLAPVTIPIWVALLGIV